MSSGQQCVLRGDPTSGFCRIRAPVLLARGTEVSRSDALDRGPVILCLSGSALILQDDLCGGPLLLRAVQARGAAQAMAGVGHGQGVRRAKVGGGGQDHAEETGRNLVEAAK